MSIPRTYRPSPVRPGPVHPDSPQPRPAVIDDIDELIRLRTHLLGPGGGDDTAPYRATGPEQERAWQESYRDWLGARLETDGPVLVTVMDDTAPAPGPGKLVACATAVVDERAPSPACLSGRAGWIQSVVVDPAARGRGLGGVIVDHALTWLKGQGADEVFLQSTARASSLYERAGFAGTGEDLLFKVLNTPTESGSPSSEETAR